MLCKWKRTPWTDSFLDQEKPKSRLEVVVTTVATALMEVSKPLPLRRILVIEDDRTIQAEMRQLFELEGYGVEIANTGAEGQQMLRNAAPSLVLLGLQTAETSSQRLLAKIRFVCPYVPIIVLGRSSSVTERILFLDLGAHDYVVKPYNSRELLARVRAALRRSEGNTEQVFAFGDVQVDFRKMEVQRQGTIMPLTALEFKVVKFMIQHSERALTREELLNEVWGYQNYPTTRTVDNHILKLRQKLEQQPSSPVHFLTIHCVGYKFVPHADNVQPHTALQHVRLTPAREDHMTR